MNFIKKAVNKATSGIELETLKLERGNLKRQIKHLEDKIKTYHQQKELQKTMIEGLDKINQTFEQVTIMCSSNNVVTTQTTPTTTSISTNTDVDSDDGVEDIEDPDSFENIQKASHSILQAHKNEVKNIVDKLTIMVASGIEKHQADIDKKNKRIEEINKRLSILRSKK